MLQPRFWQLLFLGLLSSFTIYSIHFSNPAPAPKEINSRVSLSPSPGKYHILLTQGAGFIGSHVALALLEAGHAVTLVDDPQSSFGHLYKLLAGTDYQAKVLSCDQDDAEQLQAVLSAAKPAVDIVLHLEAPLITASSYKSLEALASSTSRILAVLKAIDSSYVAKLVVSSNYAVYGTPESQPVDESAPCHPTTAAGHAALFTESAVSLYATTNPTLKVAVLRHANVMGADPKARLGSMSNLDGAQYGHRALSTLDICLAAAKQKSHQQQHNLPVPENSKQTDGDLMPCSQEYVHVNDLAAAFVVALSKVSHPPVVYNVGTGKLLSNREVTEACHKLFGIAPQLLQQIVGETACYGVTGNITKIVAETGWRPHHQLDDALKHSRQIQQLHHSISVSPL